MTDDTHQYSKEESRGNLITRATVDVYNDRRVM